MDYKNGNQKDYEVIGEALMPYTLDYPYADCIYITVLVPEEEYITQTGNESAMYAAIDAKKGEDKQIKEYIDKNIPIFGRRICDCSIANCIWSKADFSKYARYGIFLPAASYNRAMCAYDSNFGWDCVCDTKVSV